MAKSLRFPRSFAFRLDDRVASQLAAVAAAHGYRPAEWARKIVEEALGVEFDRRGVRSRILHADLLRQYLVELGRQGNNLNQIAKQLNSDPSPAGTACRDALDALRHQNERATTAVLDALGAGTDV